MAKSHEHRLKSRNEMRAHRKNIQELGFEFPLTATSLGLTGDDVQVARVRRITLTDQAAINQIPQDSRRLVNAGLDYVEQQQRKIAEEGITTETLEDRVRNNTRVLPAADAFCLVTFLEPMLVATEAELEQFPDAWVVGTDIDAADRIDWFFACLNADSEAAKKLRPFRPRPTGDVSPGPVSHDDREAAAPAPEAPQGPEPRSISLLQG
jgi:hypothetical protein